METDPPALSHWCKVMELIQAAFWEGLLAEYSMWQVVVLIPKAVWYYHGIFLLGVVWKVVTVILNFRFVTFIAFHDVIHSLWAGCGTGTASLKAKLLQKLMAMGE